MLLGNLRLACRNTLDWPVWDFTFSRAQLPHPVVVIKPCRTHLLPCSLPFSFPFHQIHLYIPVLSPSVLDKNIPSIYPPLYQPPPPSVDRLKECDWLENFTLSWKVVAFQLLWSLIVKYFSGFASTCFKGSLISFLSYLLPPTHLYLSHPLHFHLSSRLTAFVLKSFAQSRGFIFIDPEELRAAKSWLIKHQRDDGSFPAMGRILNKDLQVGLGLHGGGVQRVPVLTKQDEMWKPQFFYEVLKYYPSWREGIIFFIPDVIRVILS